MKRDITENELRKAYKVYADSHCTPPEDPNSFLLAPRLWSVRPMQHSFESFSEEYKNKKTFYIKYKLKQWLQKYLK